MRSETPPLQMEYLSKKERQDDYDEKKEDLVVDVEMDIEEGDDEHEHDNNHDNDDEQDDVFDEEFDGHAIRELRWDDSSYFRVVIQVYGSVLPGVFPYVLVNGITLTVVWYLKHMRGIDLTAHPSGHSYLAMLLSFILAARAKRALESYAMKASLFSRIYQKTHDVVDYTCFLTQNDKSDQAKQWRQDVCFSVLLLLRVLVAVLEYRTKTNPWLLPQMLDEIDDLWAFDNPHDMFDPRSSKHHHPRNSPNQSHPHHYISESRPNLKDNVMGGVLRKSLAHIPKGLRNPMDDMFRAPLLLAWNVRREILKQRDDTWLNNSVWEVQIAEEFRVLESVDGIMKSYSDLYVMVSTLTPFPTYQLVETILFVFVFTMPLALCHQTWDHYLGAPSLFIPLLLSCIITYGFIGIGFVCAKMNDPFGAHAVCDFDCLGYTQVCMEDCYMTIYRHDGKKWALNLRKRLRPHRKPKQA